MMAKRKIEKRGNDGVNAISSRQGRREKLSPRQAIECNRSLMLSALATRCIAAKPKATLTWSSSYSVTRKLSSIDQTSKRSLRLSAIRKSLKKLVFRQKPPKIPTMEEFDAMDDDKKYVWAVVGTRLPSPWDSTETLSRSLLRQLISKNHLQAKYTYSTMIFTGSMRGEVSEAIRLWEECSRAGHSWAKSNLARILAEGKVVPQDLDRAVRLYREAWDCAPVLSESHAHTSALNLADLYSKLGDLKEAAVWLHKAADETHDILAQYQLGHAYSYGKFDLSIDLECARQYTQRAADGGLVLAQHNLGCLYYEGSPTNPPDYVAAAHYFSKAHYQDYYWSTLNLASMFAAGKGVSQNFATARVLVTDAAHFGTPEQQTAAADVKANIEKAEAGETIFEAPTTSLRQAPFDTKAPLTQTSASL